MPILHSNLETDLRLATQIDQALLITLTDMASIRNVPGAIDFHGTVNGTLSDTSRLRYVSLGGADHFAAATEVENVAETALTDTSVDIAVTRHSLTRNISDLAVGTGAPGSDVDPLRLASDMPFSWEGRFNDLFATVIATAGTDVGTSTVDASVDDYFDGIFQLEQSNNVGPYFGMFAPVQITDLQSSLRSEGGALQFIPATAEMLRIMGQGVVGSFLGVTWFKSSDVTSAGGNRHGAMWAAGAIGYKTMIPQPAINAGSAIVVRMNELLVEITRDASAATTEVHGSAYAGLSLKEDARIVGFVTDA